MNENEYTPTPPAYDKLGRLIHIGDYLVYGHALGRCAGLRIGKVMNIKAYRGHYTSEPILWRITVQGIDDDWTDRPALLARKGTLQFPNRMVVVDTLPSSMVDMLKDVV